MPILNWIGRDAVVNHDKDVPFRLLKKNKSKSVGNSENLIIEGDNLEALKALLPYYRNKIKCVYIDPPYNTGNENWIYNDNVNSPKIQKWIGKVVGGEAEDLTRHDKWLCMMYPRLKLLKELLKSDGIIFVQIDYRELTSLKSVLDEIFDENLISVITVKVKDPAGVGQESPIFDVCEYILVYAKNKDEVKDELVRRSYQSNIHDDLIKGYNSAIIKFGKPKFVKQIERKNVGEIKIYACNNFEIKKFGKDTSFEEYKKHFEQIFTDYNPSGGMIKAIKENIPKKGLSYIEYVPIKGKMAGKKTKVFFHNRRTVAWLKNISRINDEGYIEKNQKISNLWEVATSSLANEGGVKFINGKKPIALLKKIFALATNDNDIILDSFAGSGSSGHAILDLNLEENTNRKFILIELESNICKNKTSKRIINSINSNKNSKDGFQYAVLDKKLFNSDGRINKSCTFEELSSYIYFTETKEILDTKPNKTLIGTHNDTDYHLIFNGIGKNMLDRKFLLTLNKNMNKIIYADKCTLDDSFLEKHRTIFKQIPYEVRLF